MFEHTETNRLEQVKALSLYELNALVSAVVSQAFDRSYWVEAELSELRERNGHCYMGLTQKEDGKNTPVAQAQARCWRDHWLLIRPYFERVTGQRLSAGMKVMLQVHAQFHPLYGFSWIVDDINPEYSLGDMVRHRREILRQLEQEGVLNLNKELPLPMFAQRVAVVSSEGAAGYGDFRNQLENNEWGLRFDTTLFSAKMQGEAVESSVIDALNAIYQRADNFDVVVIIRGGGAVADLSGFDSLALAENVANFPLPVITGIGHDRDESVIDFVSHTRVKTPTAAAVFLIDHLRETLNVVDEAQERLGRYAQERLGEEEQRMWAFSTKITSLFSVMKVRQEAKLMNMSDRLFNAWERNVADARHNLDMLAGNLDAASERRMMTERHRLDLIAQSVVSADPWRLLQMGYSLTLKDGRIVKDVNALHSGDSIETRLKNGSVFSKVE